MKKRKKKRRRYSSKVRLGLFREISSESGDSPAECFGSHVISEVGDRARVNNSILKGELQIARRRFTGGTLVARKFLAARQERVTAVRILATSAVPTKRKEHGSINCGLYIAPDERERAKEKKGKEKRKKEQTAGIEKRARIKWETNGRNEEDSRENLEECEEEKKPRHREEDRRTKRKTKTIARCSSEEGGSANEVGSTENIHSCEKGKGCQGDAGIP